MEEVLNRVADSIPTLENSKYKGNMGRIGVLGGSKEYSGAPYFAGITALYCGADIVHVFSAAAAAQSIKCYSPELIVHPTLDNDVEEPSKWLERLHGLVIGPGLGMSENIPNTIKMMAACRAANKPMVIDADGIYIVAKHKDLISGYRKAIITPNVNEFSRLYKTVINEDASDDINEAARLAKALGNVTVVRKGPVDVISDGDVLLVCDAEGSPRRCGGQGDLLSGAAAVFSCWLDAVDFRSPSASVAAGLAACVLTRRCANLAYQKFRRSTVTLKIIDEIQTAFEQLFLPKRR